MFAAISSAIRPQVLKSLVGGDPLEAERKNGNEGIHHLASSVLITCKCDGCGFGSRVTWALAPPALGRPV